MLYVSKPRESAQNRVKVSNVSGYYPLSHVDRQSRSIKAESFLRLLDMLFQIMDPWGCRSTPHGSKLIKYTIVSLAIQSRRGIKKTGLSGPLSFLTSHPTRSVVS